MENVKMIISVQESNYTGTIQKLEKKVNEYLGKLESNNRELVDIKYSTSIHTYHFASAMVITRPLQIQNMSQQPN